MEKNRVLEQETQNLHVSMLHLLSGVPLPRIKQERLNSGKKLCVNPGTLRRDLSAVKSFW